MAWLSRLEILTAGGSVSHQAWSSNAFKRDIQTFVLAPWKLGPFCSMGDDPRQARWCSWRFVLDYSWTLRNQRPSHSRNGCRAREEPLKPCQEILFSSTLFFSVNTKNCSKASCNTTGPRNMHMSRVGTVLTEERGKMCFSRFRHKTAVDHQDINC